MLSFSAIVFLFGGMILLPFTEMLYRPTALWHPLTRYAFSCYVVLALQAMQPDSFADFICFALIVLVISVVATEQDNMLEEQIEVASANLRSGVDTVAIAPEDNA
jgi:hypothetical protein